MFRLEPYLSPKETRRQIERDELRLLGKAFDIMSLCFYARLRPRQAERVISRLQSAIDALRNNQLPAVHVVGNTKEPEHYDDGERPRA